MQCSHVIRAEPTVFFRGEAELVHLRFRHEPSAHLGRDRVIAFAPVKRREIPHALGGHPAERSGEELGRVSQMIPRAGIQDARLDPPGVLDL